MKKQYKLNEIKNGLDRGEEQRLSPWACLSSHAVRGEEDHDIDHGHRQNFAIDADRILHSLAYTRYIDKTQVFYLVKHDHITHRVLHVQLVSKIGRTIGRLLRLNEDLIEAVALGHDIGHTPFGHDGECFLSELCREHGVGYYLHNVQSVRFMQEIERKGRGWNLTLQVLDGFFCHDGELHVRELEPDRNKGFETLYRDIRSKGQDPSMDFRPMTMEGCVVRMADTISYIGRDIEDAIRLGLLRRKDIPGECRSVLGDTNGRIVYVLVEDLVANSLEESCIRFSTEVGRALETLKEFSRECLYNNEKVREQVPKVKLMFELLFREYIKDLEGGNDHSDIQREFLDGMSDDYLRTTPRAGIVRDFIAGMTDDYFLSQCRKRLLPMEREGLI